MPDINDEVLDLMHEVGNRAFEVPHLVNEVADLAREAPDLIDEVRDLIFGVDSRLIADDCPSGDCCTGPPLATEPNPLPFGAGWKPAA